MSFRIILVIPLRRTNLLEGEMGSTSPFLLVFYYTRKRYLHHLEQQSSAQYHLAIHELIFRLVIRASFLSRMMQYKKDIFTLLIPTIPHYSMSCVVSACSEHLFATRLLGDSYPNKWHMLSILLREEPPEKTNACISLALSASLFLE